MFYTFQLSIMKTVFQSATLEKRVNSHYAFSVENGVTKLWLYEKVIKASEPKIFGRSL